MEKTHGPAQPLSPLAGGGSRELPSQTRFLSQVSKPTSNLHLKLNIKQGLTSKCKHCVLYDVGGFSYNGTYNFYDEIFMFDADAGESGEWRQVGRMRLKRFEHSMSTINFNEIKDYCKYEIFNNFIIPS